VKHFTYNYTSPSTVRDKINCIITDGLVFKLIKSENHSFVWENWPKPNNWVFESVHHYGTLCVTTGLLLRASEDCGQSWLKNSWLDRRGNRRYLWASMTSSIVDRLIDCICTTSTHCTVASIQLTSHVLLFKHCVIQQYWPGDFYHGAMFLHAHTTTLVASQQDVYLDWIWFIWICSISLVI